MQQNLVWSWALQMVPRITPEVCYSEHKLRSNSSAHLDMTQNTKIKIRHKILNLFSKLWWGWEIRHWCTSVLAMVVVLFRAYRRVSWNSGSTPKGVMSGVAEFWWFWNVNSWESQMRDKGLLCDCFLMVTHWSISDALQIVSHGKSLVNF